MTISRMDVMVDVTPNLTVFRQDGVWHWRGGPNATKADVIKELAAQVGRLGMKHGLLVEALEGLKLDLTHSP